MAMEIVFSLNSSEKEQGQGTECRVLCGLKTGHLTNHEHISALRRKPSFFDQNSTLNPNLKIEFRAPA